MTPIAIVVPGGTVSRIRKRLVREAERVARTVDTRVAVGFRPARIAPTPGAIAWELAASTVARRQVRAHLDRS